MTADSESVREKLQGELGTIDWPLLAVHARSGNLILVSPDIEFLDAAVAVAGNDTQQVSTWVEAGQLTKLDESEQAALDGEQGVFFQFVVVAPFVLARRVLLS